MTTPEERLAARAHTARESLERASAGVAVPPSPVSSTRKDPGARDSRWRVPVAAALAAAVLVVGVGLVQSRHGRGVVQPGVLSSVAAGDRPVAVTTDGREVWVADEATGDVLCFDARTLRERWRVRAGTDPVALALGDGALWVLDARGKQLVRLEPATGRRLGSTNTSLDPVGVAVTPGAVWVLARGNRTLDHYDPRTLSQVGSVVLPAGASSLAAGPDALWVVAGPQLLRVRLDATRDSGGESIAVGGRPTAIAADGAGLWVSLASKQLVRLSTGAAPTVVLRRATDAPVTAISSSASGGALVATSAGSLTRMEPSGATTTLPSPGTPLGSLTSSRSLVVGVAPTLGLLYATEVSS